jgi:hypothetical protein
MAKQVGRRGWELRAHAQSAFQFRCGLRSCVMYRIQALC